MSINRFAPLADKQVLLLQGPMGPFFKKLDHYLRAIGAKTFRICFNGGDRFFAERDNRFDFNEEAAHWQTFITDFYLRKKIDAIILYGDCRFYHRVAKDVASRYGIRIFVFEEGYVRPNFVTLEENGVNAHSALPRDSQFYQRLKSARIPANTSREFKYSFHRWGFFAIIYFIFMVWWRYRYPHNRHHRNTNIGFEIVYGVRNGLRKIGFALTEKQILAALTKRLSKKYYFVPLQVQYDFQIAHHSPYGNMEEFILTVMASFADHAPNGTLLVFKHHPMDRGRALFYRYIRKQSQRMGLSDRVVVVHDVHLPTCLKNAIGTITINSTVGIASLFHGTPTIVLGDALYDIDGLTCKDMTLDHFWSTYQRPDKRLFHRFRNHLIEKTQLHGSFYQGFPRQVSQDDNEFRKPLSAFQ